LTGLAVDDISLRVNGQVKNEIQLWLGGHDIIQAALAVEPSTSSSRLRFSSRSGQQITVRFFSRLGSFNRIVSKSLSISDLYKLAFRGMKGRHPKFELNSNNASLSPSGNPLSSTNIQNNSIIHIVIQHSSSQGTAVGLAVPGSENTGLEELCLIKVYRDLDVMLFSYWVPKITTTTFASVLFKYWRYYFEMYPHASLKNFIVWTGMKKAGDGHRTGQVPHHWTQLSEYLTPDHAHGKLKRESGFDMSDSSDISDEDSDEDSHENAHIEDSNDEDVNRAAPLVLKIHIGGEPMKKLSGKDLSRVSLFLIRKLF